LFHSESDLVDLKELTGGAIAGLSCPMTQNGPKTITLRPDERDCVLSMSGLFKWACPQ